jgi:uncharacterized protein
MSAPHHPGPEAAEPARRSLSPVSPDDARVVAGQIGRGPRPLSGIASRCPYGFPAVIESLPYDREGRPFPTLYYLTCPTAVAAVSSLESEGGVELFQRAVERDPGLRASLDSAVEQTRARRAELASGSPSGQSAPCPGCALDDGASLVTGVGGVADPARLKCLHAHAAHALARPGYRLGAEVLAAAGDLWCSDRRCAAFIDAGRQEAEGTTPGGETQAP